MLKLFRLLLIWINNSRFVDEFIDHVLIAGNVKCSARREHERTRVWVSIASILHKKNRKNLPRAPLSRMAYL